jgi:hypothetical protein
MQQYPLLVWRWLQTLGIWLRSPGFSPSDKMSCTFSFNLQCATTEMACLRKFLDLLLPYPCLFFHRIQLIHFNARSLHDLLGFVQHAVLLTGCFDLVLSNITYEELCECGKGVTGKEKRTPPTMDLPSLQCLKLTHFDASPLQWAAFLSSFYFPSLHLLDVSIKHFIHLRYIQFP